MNKNKLKIIRLSSKIFLNLGGRRILRLMSIDETKIADRLVKGVTDNNEIIEIHGLKIKKSKTARLTILTGENEPSTTALIEKELKPGMNVLDLGANYGWFTLISSKIIGNTGHVFSFEPDPNLMKTLKENVALNDLTNVSFFPVAISNISGNAKLSLNPDYPTRNKVNSKTLLENTINIDTISVDEFCEQKDLKVDFIKMDIEGSEVKAFEGMKKTLLNNPKIKMIVEFNPHAISDVGSSPEDFITFLQQYGLIFEVIDEHKKDRLNPITKKQLLKSDVVNLFCHK